MYFLANKLSGGDEILIIALCVSIFVVMALNFLLLVFLHKKNKKFKHEDEVLAPDEITSGD